MENKYFMHIGYAIQWLLIGLAGMLHWLSLVFSRAEHKEYERKENSNWLVNSILVNYPNVPLALAYGSWLLPVLGCLKVDQKYNGELMPCRAWQCRNSCLMHRCRVGSGGIVVVSDQCDDLCQQQVYRASAALYYLWPKQC